MISLSDAVLDGLGDKIPVFLHGISRYVVLVKAYIHHPNPMFAIDPHSIIFPKA